MNEKPISLKSKVTETDLPKIAEQIVETYRQRQKSRKDLEQNWKEIDRQLRMEPELGHKQTQQGEIIPGLAWLPEIELPLQAQTLEVLLGDVMRFKFPRGRDWYRASVALTQDYLNDYQSVKTPIPGEKGPDLEQFSQEDANRLAQAVPAHFHNQYPFRQHIARCDVEALKYGFGVGRVRKVRKELLGHTVKGRKISQEIPMLIPRSAKNVYLDDSTEAVMHEGQVIGPNIIQYAGKNINDIRLAASKDKTYIKSQISRLKPDENNCVTLLELEGDLVYHTSQSVIVVKNTVLTAGYSGGDGGNYGLIRQQEGEGGSTYIVFDYHKESADSVYATAPLMKGLPIQKMSSQVMNQLIASGSLKITPPVGYDGDDAALMAMGGPNVAPGAQWPSVGEVQPYDLGGDPAVFFQIFAGLNGLYNDVTGGHPARLGAQTKSHTTAFAKDAELSQGAVRTVDYTDDVLLDPMTRLLEMEYRMGLQDWKKQLVYVEAWDSFVELQRKHLPDVVKFRALGAGASSEDQAKLQQKLSAVQFALQVDATAVQLGREPKLDHGAIIEQVLESAGFQDVSEVTTEENEPAPAPEQLAGVASADPSILQ